MAKADPLGSKPSGVSSNRRPGWPQGSSASWQRASRLLLALMVQFLVIETAGPPVTDPQLTLSVGANFANFANFGGVDRQKLAKLAKLAPTIKREGPSSCNGPSGRPVSNAGG